MAQPSSVPIGDPRTLARLERYEAALRTIALQRLQRSHTEDCDCPCCIAWRALNEER